MNRWSNEKNLVNLVVLVIVLWRICKPFNKKVLHQQEMFHLHHEVATSSMISNQLDLVVDQSMYWQVFIDVIEDFLSSYDKSSSRDNDRYDDDYRKYYLYFQLTLFWEKFPKSNI